MNQTVDRHDALSNIWSLIHEAHSALLVSVAEDGSLDSRPMGCVQHAFDGTIWFFTFASSAKVKEIADNSQVLVSYARPSAYEYVSLSGRARVIEHGGKVHELWSEAFRVWFPAGPDDPELRLIAVEVDEAKYWINPASAVTYGWAYVKAKLLGQRSTAEQVADIGSVQL